MTDHINLFGKKCDDYYTQEQLINMAQKMKVITTRQSHNQLCNGLRAYFEKNQITNIKQLEEHIPRDFTIIDEKSTLIHEQNINIDLLFNIVEPNFFEQVEYFENLRNYTSNIATLDDDAESSNGYVYKLRYNISDVTIYDVVLKMTQDKTSDSLVYEYLVGQCMNEFCKFYPCFIKTYSIGLFKSIDLRNQFIFRQKDQRSTNTLDHYIRLLDKSNIENMILNGCKSNDLLTIFTQFIEYEYNLKDFIKTFSSSPSFHSKMFIKNEYITELYTLTTILHMIYQLLSSFHNKFTHYDFHMNNVLLMKVPNQKFIHVIYHYPDNTIIHYNMTYIPIIIDYGRCFVQCNNMDKTKVNSRDIMKIVCNNDNKNKKNPICKKNCGDISGYVYSTNYNNETDTFEPSRISNVDYTKKNISHDCRLLHEINLMFDFSRLPKENFIVEHLVDNILNQLTDMVNRFGTMEDTEDIFRGIPFINNIITTASELSKIVVKPEFNIQNEKGLDRYQLYGTLHIWTDLSRPFEFY
jgi:hypothetical protein